MLHIVGLPVPLPWGILSLGWCPGELSGAGADVKESHGMPDVSAVRGEEEKEMNTLLLQVLFFLCPPQMPLEGSAAPFPRGRVVLLLLCTSSVPNHLCGITRGRLQGS